jgi:2-methylisocitrate lyase-like PEP mutase family enzyme
MATPLERFHALHQSGCFVLPNPWDVGSAVLLERLGFVALASSSAGLAFSRGQPDSVWGLPLDMVLGHLRELVAATPLPVNADFQSGYSRDVKGLAKNVTLCVHTGVAGLSIEDNHGEGGLYAQDVAVERLRTARAAIDATGVPVVLTARCEAYLVGDPDAERTVFSRLPAFAEAGADCLYAPGIRDLAVIARLVREVAPKPVNVLVSQPGLTVAQLADAGVRRISVGSALARAAWGGFLRAARAMLDPGEFAFGDAASFAELNAFFGGDRPLRR